MLVLPRVVYVPGGWKQRPIELVFPFAMGAGKGVNVVWSFWKEDPNTGGLLFTLQSETARALMPYKMETKTVCRWSEFMDRMVKEKRHQERGI